MQYAGIPTGTRFGVGCVAPVVNPSEDYRPTIILPTRLVPPEENQTALDDLIELPIPQPRRPLRQPVGSGSGTSGPGVASAGATTPAGSGGESPGGMAVPGGGAVPGSGAPSWLCSI